MSSIIALEMPGVSSLTFDFLLFADPLPRLLYD